MKLFLVWKTRHDIVNSKRQLLGAYLDQESAQSELKKLEDNNSDPLVEDYYGPLSGTTFEIEAMVTQD